MKLTYLIEQLKLFYGTLVDIKVLRESLNELPDDLELTISYEKAPGGVMKNGQILLNQNITPKTVGQRKKELDNDIKILGARVRQIKLQMIKELEKDEL